MKLYEKLRNKNEKIAVIGLGYVGMPLAIAFSSMTDVIGFDVNEKKVKLYLSGIDPTKEVGDEAVAKSNVYFTHDESYLQTAKFHIIAVPTPINQDKTPNLQPVISASQIVGRNLKKGSIVVYESTVYPGVTEDICIPLLEEASQLKAGIDFKVGYSPERINPGDPIHRVDNIVKIVSGMDDETLDEVAKTYELIIKAGVFRAKSIKVAEAAKVVENSQRDINIAFMNELAMVFELMGIDSKDVIDAMNTKWNALKFYPGLVGGHCIGVDPYYFIYEAQKLGYHSQIIHSGRKINDGMGEFIGDIIIKKLIKTDKVVRQSKVVILGFTFKENTPDTRNSKVIDIINTLRTYGIEPLVIDPVADNDEAMEEYGILIRKDYEELTDADCIVLAVAHEEFRDLSMATIDGYFKRFENNADKIIIDVKSLLDHKEYQNEGYTYWRL